MRALPAILATLFLLVAAPTAGAYGWPLKPFDKPHPIRGSFGDPRFHLDAEGQLSAFHFGVDISARDGTPVYAVESGVVVRSKLSSVTIGRRSGRRFGYWHIIPCVRSGTYIRAHQLIGFVASGWGHVHFAESVHGTYVNPLRRGALAPFSEHTPPTVEWVQLRVQDAQVDATHVSGMIDVVASIYDTPPLPPPAPWNVARLAPATIRWNLLNADGLLVATSPVVDFAHDLPDNDVYGWIYAPGSYQNKPNRPGQYLYWIAHSLDTTGFPNGAYRLEVVATDTRGNAGAATVDLTIAN